MDERERYALGAEVRRDVLGHDHPPRAPTSLTADYEDIVTRLAWGETWSRPGLDRPTRRLITIAMLIALNRPAELRAHLTAAHDQGEPLERLMEVVLQSVLYCGVPAASSALAVLTDLEAAGTAGRPPSARQG